mmetsp:Transcript_22870/g.59784  ORF Transcript_22870/g.59784 Transcript_22870/m.59784 type:complete len:197 (-) Transcript_22870:711-1301(-)
MVAQAWRTQSQCQRKRGAWPDRLPACMQVQVSQRRAAVAAVAPVSEGGVAGPLLLGKSVLPVTEGSAAATGAAAAATDANQPNNSSNSSSQCEAPPASNAAAVGSAHPSPPLNFSNLGFLGLLGLKSNSVSSVGSNALQAEPCFKASAPLGLPAGFSLPHPGVVGGEVDQLACGVGQLAQLQQLQALLASLPQARQ